MAYPVGDSRLLTLVETMSEAFGLAAVISALAGGAAALHELAAGCPLFDGDGAVTPRNPQGQLGVDLSGPPWGSAIRHPIAWFGSLKRNTTRGYGHAAAVGFAADDPGIVDGWIFWNRPYDQLPIDGSLFVAAPYSMGEIDIRAHLASAGSVDCTLKATQLWSQAEENETTAAFTVTSTSEGNFTAVAFVPLLPGINCVQLKFESADAIRAYVDCCVINQVVKRTH